MPRREIRSAPAAVGAKRQHELTLAAQRRQMQLHVLVFVQHRRIGADQHEPLAGDVGHGPHEVTVETVEYVQIGMQLMPRYTALQPLDGVLRRSLEGHPGHSPCSAEYGHTELAGARRRA